MDLTKTARDRILKWGAHVLSEDELLSLLCGGTPPRARLPWTSLKALLAEDPRLLCARRMLGPRHGTLLLAAVELGRRAQAMQERRPRLANPAEIYRYLSPHMAGLRNEVFHVLCFNTRNVLLRDARIAEGTVNACPVDPREVFAEAVSSRASAIAVAHNHPSGDPTPSSLDQSLTAQLVAGSRALNVTFLDHLIIGDGAYHSFLEHRWMDRTSPTQPARPLSAAAPELPW